MPAETFEPRSAPGPDQTAPSSTVEQSFPVGDQCRLIVENPRGQIKVTGWDRPEIHLRATKLIGGSSLARFNMTQVDVSHEGDTVAARTVLDRSAFPRDRGIWEDVASDAFGAFADLLRHTGLPAEVLFEVDVPRHADLQLRGLTSLISVEGVRGAIRINNVSGPIHLDHAQGDLNLSTVSGHVDGSALEGYLDAKAVSGSIRVNGRLDVVRANTVSGSMEVGTPLAPTGSYDFHSVSGSVTVRAPADTSASISAHGVSLGVTSDLPCTVLRDVRRPGSRQWQAELNGGSTAVQFRTVSGHLYLTYLDRATPTPSSDRGAATDEAIPAARADETTTSAEDQSAETTGQGTADRAEEPVAAESARLRILRALEHGDLAVDDALKQLEEIRGSA